MEHLKGFDEVLKYVNELSGTIDLHSTLVRAESLFRKFQRMVEAIDRQNNFPQAPIVRQRLPQPPSQGVRPGSDGRPRTASTSGPSNRAQGAAATGREQTLGEVGAQASAADKAKVISPELRALLSRDPPKLSKEEVREHS